MPDGTVTTLECPRDEGTMLVAVDRNGVMVDACPSCRGVWLDRGELDKLIDLEAAASDNFANEIRGGSRDSESYDRGDKHGSGHGSSHGSGQSGKGRKKKRSSFLGDMLDFG